MNRIVSTLAGALAVVAGCSERPATPPGGSGAAPVPPPSRLVVALKPDKNPDAMLAEKQTLEAYLSGQLGRPVEVIIPLSAAVILEGFANGTIDLGYLGATEMLTARDRGTAAVLLAGEIDGRTTYQSYWVTLKEKPYHTVAELKGRPVAFASKTSTSGCVIPHWALIEQRLLREKGDPEEFFGRGNVWYGTGYVSAIEQVLNGAAEAAAVSYYVLDHDKHLTPGQRSRLRKLQVQGPVPTHVIAVRASLPPEERARLRHSLESLNAPANQALRDKLFTSRLVPVDEDQHLAPLRAALVRTGRLP
jgi:phosphonate transport system substrate-binding protein